MRRVARWTYYFQEILTKVTINSKNVDVCVNGIIVKLPYLVKFSDYITIEKYNSNLCTLKISTIIFSNQKLLN